MTMDNSETQAILTQNTELNEDNQCSLSFGVATVMDNKYQSKNTKTLKGISHSCYGNGMNKQTKSDKFKLMKFIAKLFS